MRDAELPEFSALLDATCSLLSRGQYQPSDLNTALWFRSLRALPLAQVRAAFDAHISDPQRGRFVPVPADILAQVEGAAADDGRPGADEAWSIAVRAADESETVVWTREMAQAWEASRPVMALGDEVGARMAFRDAYGRLVSEARAARIAPSWTPSLGFDVERRSVAIGAAVERGLLPAAEVAGLLPAPAEDHRGPPSPQVLAVLLDLRDRITTMPEVESQDVVDKRTTAEAKERAAQMVAEYRGQE